MAVYNPNRNSYMSFRLVQSRWPWMTLNGIMALICYISPNSVDTRAHCVKVV